MDKNLIQKTTENIKKILVNKLPAEYFYDNLTNCIIDAVYSIGINYTSVKNVIERYNKYLIEKKLANTIKNYCDLYEKYDAEKISKDIFNDMHRTSSKNGILKSKAVYEICKILSDEEIETKEDFCKKMNSSIDNKILSVKGQGSGIMLEYLYMLAGDDDLCKKDRHLIRYLNNITQKDLSNEEIQDLLEEVSINLKANFPNISVRLIDYSIWTWQRNNK